MKGSGESTAPSMTSMLAHVRSYSLGHTRSLLAVYGTIPLPEKSGVEQRRRP